MHSMQMVGANVNNVGVSVSVNAIVRTRRSVSGGYVRIRMHTKTSFEKRSVCGNSKHERRGAGLSVENEQRSNLSKETVHSSV